MINLRLARDDDKVDIANICRDCNKLYEEIFPDFLLQQSDYLEKKLPQEYIFYIIESKNRTLGFLCYKELTTKDIYLAMLYFYQSNQKKGYGSKSLEVLESLLKKNNYKDLYLLAHQEANWALNFYEKNKYKLIYKDEGRIKSYKNSMLKDNYYKDTFLYKKVLS